MKSRCGRKTRRNGAPSRNVSEMTWQLLDAIGGVLRAHLRKRPPSLAVGKRGREQCGRHDTADKDEKNAALHRRDECLHGVVSIATSALNT